MKIKVFRWDQDEVKYILIAEPDQEKVDEILVSRYVRIAVNSEKLVLQNGVSCIPLEDFKIKCTKIDSIALGKTWMNVYCS